MLKVKKFDEEWATRHKDEIEKINVEAEKLRKNRRIQKIRKKFLEESQEKNNHVKDKKIW